MIVKGFTSANCRSPSGIDATGTKAEEMNVNGNTMMKPTELTVSEDFATSPMNASTHENE